MAWHAVGITYASVVVAHGFSSITITRYEDDDDGNGVDSDGGNDDGVVMGNTAKSMI